MDDVGEKKKKKKSKSLKTGSFIGFGSRLLKSGFYLESLGGFANQIVESNRES